jgi:hypothetical protein
MKNDNIEQIINHMSTEGQQVKTLLKLISKAKCNYLCIDDEVGLVYIHIINIIYAVSNIEKKIQNYEKTITPFMHISKSYRDEHNIKIQNILNNLISFKKQVNKNQILQYVFRYYYSKILNKKPDFENFKKLIALLFLRNPNKLFEKELNMNNIDEPFSFLYYKRWIIDTDPEEHAKIFANKSKYLFDPGRKLYYFDKQRKFHTK